MTVPIANGGSLRSGWKRSKLNVIQAQLQKEQNSQTLEAGHLQILYGCYCRHPKIQCQQKAVETAAKAYDFAQKRYDLNLLSTYDLLNSQIALQTARAQLLYSQFDYVFKMKLLEFYKGQGLKL